jgi:hypothetical protein
MKDVAMGNIIFTNEDVQFELSLTKSESIDVEVLSNENNDIDNAQCNNKNQVSLGGAVITFLFFCNKSNFRKLKKTVHSLTGSK